MSEVRRFELGKAVNIAWRGTPGEARSKNAWNEYGGVSQTILSCCDGTPPLSRCGTRDKGYDRGIPFFGENGF